MSDLDDLSDHSDLLMQVGGGASKPTKKKVAASASKKLTNAPKRFKSSFIFFSMAKHKAIKEQMAKEGGTGKTTNITKIVSDAWRNMDPEERARYDEMARQDKVRYELEKSQYQGPRGGGSGGRGGGSGGGVSSSGRKRKDPNAPKRPMSAFLAFANTRRGAVKADNPDCSNGEISKLLSVMWKEAPDDQKKEYREKEAVQWATYKARMVEWKKTSDGRKKASKAARAATGQSSQPKKKRKKKSSSKSNNNVANTSNNDLGTGDVLSSLKDSIFGDADLAGIGGGGGGGGGSGVNPNQDEMMAASALRGVRGGPNFPGGGGGGTGGAGFGGGLGGTGTGLGGGGFGTGGFAGMDGLGLSQQQQQLLQAQANANAGGAGGLSGLGFGMNAAMNSLGGMNTGNFQQDNAGLLGQLGGFGMNNPQAMLMAQGAGLSGLGNPQAMLMAQALRGGGGGFNPLLGLSDQQPSLSQLASLAGAQNGGDFGGGGGGGLGGVGNFLNDNSTNSMGGGGQGGLSGGNDGF